jgi:hypothetical protein
MWKRDVPLLWPGLPQLLKLAIRAATAEKTRMDETRTPVRMLLPRY